MTGIKELKATVSAELKHAVAFCGMAGVTSENRYHEDTEREITVYWAHRMPL